MRNLLAFLFLLAFVPFGHAQSPDMTLCKLRADLNGDGLFYFTYGRDSWRGQGDLICDEETADGGHRQQHRPVEINFNSTSGVGVNDASTLHIDAALVTSSGIGDVEIFSHVFSSGASERALIQWRVQTSECHMVVSVDPGTQWRVLSSLGEGNLYIR